MGNDLKRFARARETIRSSSSVSMVAWRRYLTAPTLFQRNPASRDRQFWRKPILRKVEEIPRQKPGDSAFASQGGFRGVHPTNPGFPPMCESPSKNKRLRNRRPPLPSREVPMLFLRAFYFPRTRIASISRSSSSERRFFFSYPQRVHR